MKFPRCQFVSVVVVLGITVWMASACAHAAEQVSRLSGLGGFPNGAEGIAFLPSEAGAEVEVSLQKLGGRVTREGLWLISTGQTAGDAGQCRVLAASVGRGVVMSVALPGTGVVEVTGGVARLVRPGLVEEYRASLEGIRQDFLVGARPAGTGALRVGLTVDGAEVAAAATGVTLTLAGSGREIAYSRLLVTDATGRELPGCFETGPAHGMAIVVDDENAVYPVRIDPTFSDAVWGSVGGGAGANNTVGALVMDGSGVLYAGGGFTAVGGVSANRIARWDGSSWSALGTGMNSAVRALAVSGTDLYAGGLFTTADGVTVNGIAKWDGSSWSALGTGINGVVNALAVSGTDVYAGGVFTSAGGVSVSNIAKWDGSAWSSPGSGANGAVDALAVADAELFAGGNFTTIGGVPANRIARWDGSNWSALGAGVSARVYALAVSGSDLHAGGAFASAGGVVVNNIATWDGTGWSALGAGTNSLVVALTMLGPDLYAGGYFTTADGVTVNHTATWDGGGWHLLGSGTDSFVAALAGAGSDLYVGGGFTTAGGEVSAFIAHADLSAVPEIEVEQPAGQMLVDGASLLDFGTGVVGGCSGFVVTIRNAGGLELTGLEITIDGSDAVDFSVVSGPVAPVAPGGTATFTLRFAPGVTGPKSAALHIASNDADEDPFDIDLGGVGATARALYDAAATEAGLVGADAEPDAIPFGDGMSNLAKYAFNLNMAHPGWHVMSPGGVAGLPVHSMIEVGGQEIWRLEFVRLRGCRVDYRPLRSPTLDVSTFVPMTGTITVTEIDGEWERVVVEEPIDPSGPEQGFGRLQVTLP